MNERTLQKTIRDLFIRGFTAQGIEIRTQRNFQQRNHAAPSTPTLVYHRIATTPVGWQYRKYENEQKPDGSFVARETHSSNEIITYQINALVVEPDPKDETADDMTAADLLKIARMIAVAERPSLKALGINMLHISTIADVMVQNESDNWEYQPSFDIQFSIKQELIKEVGKVTRLTGHIYRV